LLTCPRSASSNTGLEGQSSSVVRSGLPLVFHERLLCQRLSLLSQKNKSDRVTTLSWGSYRIQNRVKHDLQKHCNPVTSLVVYNWVSKYIVDSIAKKNTKHTAAGIPTWSPTVVLICRSTAYVWQSGRDAQFSADCGRMWLLPKCEGTCSTNVIHRSPIYSPEYDMIWTCSQNKSSRRTM
jgi:hypothetical protein